jgi:hypothetical protein
VKTSIVASIMRMGLLALTLGGSLGCSTTVERSESAAATATQTRYAGGRQLKRTASLRLLVADVDAASSRAQAIVTGAGGFVENLNTTPGESAYLSARVPSASLDATLDELAKLGRESFRLVSAEDVTERLVDLEATLRNQRALRDRLRALLERGQQVEELLKVEVELARVQGEVERLEAQLQSLQSDVSLSSLTVGFERKVSPGPFGLVLSLVGDVFGYLFRSPQTDLLRIP